MVQNDGNPEQEALHPNVAEDYWIRVAPCLYYLVYACVVLSNVSVSRAGNGSSSGFQHLLAIGLAGPVS